MEFFLILEINKILILLITLNTVKYFVIIYLI